MMVCKSHDHELLWQLCPEVQPVVCSWLFVQLPQLTQHKSNC